MNKQQYLQRAVRKESHEHPWLPHKAIEHIALDHFTEYKENVNKVNKVNKRR